MKTPICKYILLKLAARCNINCSYCYWFRDESVYDKPPILPLNVENAFLDKLRSHIEDYSLERFSILFHGGEPLLFGKQRFFNLCEKIRGLEQPSKCRFSLSLTTNGLLVDEDWASLFRYFRVSVTVSLDGTEALHNKHRVDFKGNGTYQRVIAAIDVLRKYDIEFGTLCVCNPDSSPEMLINHFIGLGIRHFDVLIPDHTHEDKDVPSISKYYKSLFDLWYDNKYYKVLDIRILKSFVLGLLGLSTNSEAIGYGPVTTMTMHSDGSLEPLDVLRIAGNGHTRSSINILEHTFQDIEKVAIWKEALEASIDLPEVCKKCALHNACGGGYIPQRWSNANRYNNPNVYCSDFKEIFGHISSKLIREVSNRDMALDLDMDLSSKEMKSALAER